MNHIVNRCLNPVSVPKVTGHDIAVFRCGKCPNCLRQKRNELCVRAYREFVGQQVVFLTFTYDNEHCPVYHYHGEVDTETGEIFRSYDYIEPDKSFFDEAPYEERIVYKNSGKHIVKRYHPYIRLVEDGFRHATLDISYQSINYEDIKKLFKRFRAKFGVGSLGKYLCVPEYGANGYRPHYHLMAYGLSKSQVDYLVKDWSQDYAYGHVDVRWVQDGAEDTDEICKVAAYLAKYCAKGVYDCPYIAKNYCKKPRRSVSENFGCGSANEWQKLCDVLTGADFLGRYKPNDVKIEDFTEQDFEVLARRRVYNLNGYHYPMPKFLIKKLFYNKDKIVIDAEGRIIKYIKDYKNKPIYVKKDGEKIKYRLCASELQKKVASVILGKLVDIYFREHKQDKRYLAFDSGDIEKPYVQSSEELSITFAESYFIAELEKSSIY